MITHADMVSMTLDDASFIFFTRPAALPFSAPNSPPMVLCCCCPPGAEFGTVDSWYGLRLGLSV